MAQYTRIEVAQVMKETGIVPLFYHSDIEIVKNVIKSCYDGGARVFEFTNRGDHAQDIFSEVCKWVTKDLPGMILGIGSIVDPGTASLFIQNGANFIVSPILNPEIAKVCNRRKIAWLPGCATLSEINYAEELGAEIVKIFPASQVGGPNYVKSIKAPCPWSSIMPSGGVSPDEKNLSDWFNAGVHCVGMGSKLIVKKNEIEFDYKMITELTKKSIDIVNTLKKEN
ncbi:bifunctional 4-hydroxy-2-oxoglutarate aldolase/2-dehydro-3-deoxy-phosphogluconate aldolase [Aquimarina sp. AD10]|uniref:bifunctional 4-hydroxy-2-oxoglutarate aldolase/2-dehydro-3-deoxy-phosphogluconate aldolase n=1 Tax=Aquimarina sp. AD10 TaxID=1714849 RepID=UPI000E4779DA|nr:bifunctional 4-hydroxy-2-oxoglutarate aldolase/2-dehydro-3-deoxy-phosphogluconate aldolase [Aquimarina sp. AD10]AXT58877.1 bifunctional 4-hydroxy-2-oxoglutarate aldolase/2-dehydro-3-deoxy-phosphogluconate aldolase [Aquimarina sp. AD10]RKM99648.1 bifunctional 4-hydroxy-2-oxoglutarate aldolase/2-dehydro-3-deoxy-phosphogluconate aldolase [Aquimarina sp. AD10]